MSAPCLAAALEYARQGLRVLALEPAVAGDSQSGKKPITALMPNGVSNATDDPERIRAWWAAHPEANVGIAVPGDWVVVDVDPRNGGDASYEAIGDWPDTLTAHTGGGGAHLIYQIATGTRFPGKVAGRKGLDVKQVGGYIVAAPSVHYSGGSYAWDDVDGGSRPGVPWDPSPPPAWLAALERGEAATSADPGAADRELTEAERASLDDFAALLEGHFTHGQRNPMAVAIGGALRNAGLPPSAADYVLDQLPSDAPEARLKDALGAWHAPVAAGMSKLADLLPPEAMALAGAVDLRPQWQRDASERHARLAAERDAKLAPAGAADSTPLPPTAAPALSDAELRERLGVVELATDEPPIDYLCPGLALAKSKGKITLLAGAAGAGKGPTLGRLLAGMATGKGAFGCDVPRQIKGLLLDHEGAYLTRRRLRRFAVGEGWDPAAIDQNLIVADVSSFSAAAEDYYALIVEAVNRWGVEVVGLDSYTSAMLDAGLEANQPEFAQLAKGLGQLGVCVIAIAHGNKASADREGPPRLSDIAYTGALGAMAQTAIMVRVPREDDPTLIEISCARAPEDRFKPIHVRWKDTDERPRADGRREWAGLKAEIAEAPERPLTAAEQKAAEGREAEAEAAADVYARLREEHDATETALRTGCGISHARLHSLLAAMVREGILIARGNRYSLAPITPACAEARLKRGLVE